MRRIILASLAAGVVSSAVAAAFAANTSNPDKLSPIYGVGLPDGYRKWELIAPAQEAEPLNELRAVVGNDIAVKAYRDGKLPFPDGTVLVKLAWKHTQSPEFESASIPIQTKKIDDIKGNAVEKKKTALEMISQGTCLPGIPPHVSFAAHRQWMLEHMALAFRVFARKGYCEGMAGHISVRDPENPHTFWTNPLGRHFGLLKASDMILVDYDGKAIGGNMSRPANAAGFLIHSAVHKAREDVVAACHTHSPAGKAWSAFARKSSTDELPEKVWVHSGRSAVAITSQKLHTHLGL